MVSKYFVLTFCMVIALLKSNSTLAENLQKSTDIKVSTGTGIEKTSVIRQLNEIIVSPKNSFSIWLTRVWDWLMGVRQDGSVSESRTFGQIRRLKNALIPIMFKFGVISTLISVLVFLALKTIVLLKALLILNAGGIIAKLIALKSSSGHDHHHYVPPPVWQPVGWSQNTNYNPFGSPYTHGGPSPWASTLGQGKEIHVHIHNDGKSNHHSSGGLVNSGGWENEPYGGYSEVKKNYIINPVEYQHQQQQQQQLVKIHRDDNLNYVSNRIYGNSLQH